MGNYWADYLKEKRKVAMVVCLSHLGFYVDEEKFQMLRWQPVVKILILSWEVIRMYLLTFLYMLMIKIIMKF